MREDEEWKGKYLGQGAGEGATQGTEGYNRSRGLLKVYAGWQSNALPITGRGTRRQ